jgi:23S rRNA (cytosine1962-C5)-methyltransferase
LRLGRIIQSYTQSHYKLYDGQLIYGNPLEGPVHFLENGLKFEADLKYGHKTGFYLDQRDNRAMVERISEAKNILNVFSYTGGFSVYAARGGAKTVISLDLSQPALISAKQNFAYNQDNPAIANCSHETQIGDAFKILTVYAQTNKNFDMVIIDPPAFAKKQSEQAKAISAYRRLTQLGLKILTSGGILVQSSCSSRVSKQIFIDTVCLAAKQVGRPLREIKCTGHAIDHPISFPEGEYLKCLFATG